MLRLATCEQSRQIDQHTQAAGIASDEILMESAACASALDIAQSFLPELKSAGALLVFCGPGNNGADGLALARHLASHGEGDLQIIVSEDKGSALFHKQLDRCRKWGLRVMNWREFPSTTRARLVVDALFGVGLTRALAEPYSEQVNWMNQQKAPVISLDVSSGLNADRGIALGPAVTARMTITFGLPKPGFFVQEGPHLTGKLHVQPIGFPPMLIEKIANTHFLYEFPDAVQHLPQRSQLSNKSHYGHGLLLAGQAGKWGAAVLSAQAAYRTGLGYLTLASSADPSPFTVQIPEVLTALIGDTQLWKKSFNAIGVGPGLGVTDETARLIKGFVQTQRERVVLDADAITVCAQEKIYPLPETWVLTPHAGELSRIIDIPAPEIERDRFQAVKLAHEKLGCIILLKGYHTVVFDGREFRIIHAGNSALAKAGSGDVLTGMILGFLAQQLQPIEAASLAAYLHGRLADRWIKGGHAAASLQPSDLVENLPRLMHELETGLN